ncbi:MAG: tRNA pseudouridine(38-40) synthase TruA [Dethiobacter sp.]|jgi:tRNA pseudouridine38-40 synthase|nr:tRNA pseudouridine(38-40) synthase TruA [Dethiobacter sp.]
MENIKLTLAYDGSDYHGFQLQSNALTVQEILEQALATVFGTAVRVTAAGRTDTGVHAQGQVVNFQVSTRVPVDRIPYALNAVLPKDIVVHRAEAVSALFHARYSATSKVYSYTIDNAPHHRVFSRKYTYHVKYPLNPAAMAAAAAQLVGRHDFASFRASGSAVRSTERNIMRMEVKEQESYISVTAEADGFLYNMMRIITGTLIEIGRGKRPPDLTAVLAARDRSKAGWTAPAHGLVLCEVKY